MKFFSLLVGLWVGLLCTLPASRAGAQGTLSTILTNGPTANRLNVVVLAEGYRAREKGQFLTDATNAVNRLLAAPPFQEYSGYFNAFAIFVASAQSGSDHYSPSTRLVNTYFNSSFDSYGFPNAITIPPNDRDKNYADGQGKVDALLQALMPEYDLVVMLVNDTTYGGTGEPPLAITSLNSAASDTVVHECGHALGGLADEYSTPYPIYTPIECPNATTRISRSLIRWTVWIAETTPVPTPATSPYTNLVGLFQGAEYHAAGWYRPKYDCKMNRIGIPFCEVCSEQLVKSIRHAVSAIDSFTPATADLSVTTTQAVAFGVTLLEPNTHNLSVQWFTNGAAVSRATNTALMLLPEDLGNGTHIVQAQVRDLTELVRNDPANVLSNSVTWNLSVNLGQLRLVSPRWLPEGQFSLGVTGTAPHGFVLQTSTNLLDWIPRLTDPTPLSGGQVYYTNADPGGFPMRFYRTTVTP